MPQVLERIAAILMGEELEDRMIFGDGVVDAVHNLEALIVPMEAETRRVQILLCEQPCLEHLHLGHDVEKDRVYEYMVIQQGVEAF